jgi:hypothetical protein
MAIAARFLDNIFARHSERGYIIDARAYCLPGGESCYEILYDALGYIPERIIRLRQGCSSKPLLIVDSKRGHFFEEKASLERRHTISQILL